MSSINHDPRLDRAGLQPLESQVTLDDLRRGEQGLRTPDAQGPEHAPTRPSAGEATLDPGESILNAAAWDGVPVGERMLEGHLGFEAQLGALDLSLAADLAADVIADAFV